MNSNPLSPDSSPPLVSLGGGYQSAPLLSPLATKKLRPEDPEASVLFEHAREILARRAYGKPVTTPQKKRRKRRRRKEHEEEHRPAVWIHPNSPPRQPQPPYKGKLHGQLEILSTKPCTGRPLVTSRTEPPKEKRRSPGCSFSGHSSLGKQVTSPSPSYPQWQFSKKKRQTGPQVNGESPGPNLAFSSMGHQANSVKPSAGEFSLAWRTKMLRKMDGTNSCDKLGPGSCRVDTSFTDKKQIYDAKMAPRFAFGPRHHNPDKPTARFPPIMPALRR